MPPRKNFEFQMQNCAIWCLLTSCFTLLNGGIFQENLVEIFFLLKNLNKQIVKDGFSTDTYSKSLKQKDMTKKQMIQWRKIKKNLSYDYLIKLDGL